MNTSIILLVVALVALLIAGIGCLIGRNRRRAASKCLWQYGDRGFDELAQFLVRVGVLEYIEQVPGYAAGCDGYQLKELDLKKFDLKPLGISVGSVIHNTDVPQVLEALYEQLASLTGDWSKSRRQEFIEAASGRYTDDEADGMKEAYSNARNRFLQERDKKEHDCLAAKVARWYGC
jgi:hypothetical protein